MKEKFGKSSCRNSACQLEQVVVRISRIVVDAFLYLEDVNRENRCLAVTQTCFRCQQSCSPLPSGLPGDRVCTVVNGGKRNLCACSGMHGVEVVDERLHCLVCGSPAYLLHPHILWHVPGACLLRSFVRNDLSEVFTAPSPRSRCRHAMHRIDMIVHVP